MEVVGQILEIINKAGIVGILVLVLVGGQKKWWVFGWYYQSVEADRDRWMDAALRGTDIAEKAVTRALK